MQLAAKDLRRLLRPILLLLSNNKGQWMLPCRHCTLLRASIRHQMLLYLIPPCAHHPPRQALATRFSTLVLGTRWAFLKRPLSVLALIEPIVGGKWLATRPRLPATYSTTHNAQLNKWPPCFQHKWRTHTLVSWAPTTTPSTIGPTCHPRQHPRPRALNRDTWLSVTSKTSFISVHHPSHDTTTPCTPSRLQ